MTNTLQRIPDCRIADSSGCHRYDYWNEQALFDGSDRTGWSTPSRTMAVAEFLEIDLCGMREPAMVRLQHRPINEHPGFPKALTIFARTGDGWTKVHQATDIHVAAGEWSEHEFDPVRTTALRIEFDEVGWRDNGAYFLQFMQLEVGEGTER